MGAAFSRMRVLILLHIFSMELKSGLYGGRYFILISLALNFFSSKLFLCDERLSIADLPRKRHMLIFAEDSSRKTSDSVSHVSAQAIHSFLAVFISSLCCSEARSVFFICKTKFTKCFVYYKHAYSLVQLANDAPDCDGGIGMDQFFDKILVIIS